MKIHIQIAKWFLYWKKDQFHIIIDSRFSIYRVRVFSGQPSYSVELLLSQPLMKRLPLM